MDSNKNILFPTDFSDESLNVLPYAIDYSKKADATLILVHVIESPSTMSDKLKILLGETIWDINEVDSASSFLLNEISGRIKKTYDIKVKQKVLYGHLISALLAYINKTDPEMIILSATSDNKTYKIAECAPIPVITINADTSFKEIKTILFPVSNKSYTTQKTDEIIRISAIYKAQVVLLGISPDKGDSFNDMSLHMEGILKKLESNGVSTQMKMVVGNDYTNEINLYCGENNIDLISVISNFEHGIVSLFKTTPDEKLVKSSTIPILNIPIQVDVIPPSDINAEYISPWSMKYDANMLIFPFK